jgi:hypothetical protein
MGQCRTVAQVMAHGCHLLVQLGGFLKLSALAQGLCQLAILLRQDHATGVTCKPRRGDGLEATGWLI